MRRLAIFMMATVSGFAATLTPLTWTAAGAGGYTFAMVGYDSTVFVPSRGITCAWGESPPSSFSEQQDSLYCYSYTENRTFPILISSAFHSAHTPAQGHNNQVMSYAPSIDSILWEQDGSYGNTSENYSGLFQFDMAGLVVIDKPFYKTAGVYNRNWQQNSTPQNGSIVDSTNNKWIIFPDYSGTTGRASICDISAGTCIQSTTASGPTASVNGSVAVAFNPVDGKTYWLKGGDSTLYVLDASSTGVWTQPSVTCSGVDCVGNHPPARSGAGWAYSITDAKFLLMGGYSGASNFVDAWTFNSATNAWTELCGPGMSACGYTNTSATGPKPGNRLTYDPSANAFVYLQSNSSIWLYALSTAGPYGASPVNYAPPSGSLNKTTPPASPSLSTNQGWAQDTSMATDGTTVIITHNETAPTTVSPSNCWVLIPYVMAAAAYLPTGSVNTGCAAMGLSTGAVRPSGHSVAAIVSGTQWEAHSLMNIPGGSASTGTFAYSYSSGSGTWSGGQVGCFTSGTCGSGVTSSPVSLIAVGSTPTIAVTEQNKSSFQRDTGLWVAFWNGSAWVSMGSTRLNINGSGTYATAGSLASNGSVPAACWAEEVNNNSGARWLFTTTPQIYCSLWNGSTWGQLGTTSLNQASTNWAYTPSLTYMATVWYVSWVERTQLGNLRLYVAQYNSGPNNWSLVGGGPLNIDVGSGNAFHPSLTNDGTNLYVAWEEQSAIGQVPAGWVKKWNGSAWSSLGSAISAGGGSVNNMGIVYAAGKPTIAWDELTYGNMRQVYAREWSGSAWVPMGGGSTTGGSKAGGNSSIVGGIH